jgi:molybdate transport system ATP-binding protein
MPGQHWAILGGNGSGKSTFLRLVRGELWPTPGSRGRRKYAFDDEEQTTAVGIKEKIALVSPEAQARYLQQEWKLTGLGVVHSGFGGGDYAYRRLTSSELKRARQVVDLLQIESLLPRDVQTLSTGELRKVLIARALAGSPPVLICDEICDGLDAASRARLLADLERVARNGTQLLYTTHRSDEILPAITHRLVLKAGRVVEQGKVPPQTGIDGANSSGAGSSRRAGRTNFQIAGNLEPVTPRSGRRDSAALIQIESVDVFLDRQKVLRGIDWSIQPDEHWAIVGANGAGKSTLLKLIAGDLHPALGGRVKRFGFTAKNTLWELRRRIGFVSPELQATYREAITGADVIASGLFSSVGLLCKPGTRLRRQVARLVAQLGLAPLAAKSALRMSYGEFRRILLARALIHRPKLLIFDEPFDGLDAPARGEMTKVLQKSAQSGVNLIIVTHHTSDLPDCITHVARLDGGRITSQGPVEEGRAARPG